MGMVFLALVFLAELAAVAAIGLAAYRLTGGGYAGAVAAAVAVAIAVIAWGRWASPRAVAPVALARATKAVVFGGGVALLLAAGHLGWALALAALIAVAHLGVRLTGAALQDEPGSGVP